MTRLVLNIFLAFVLLIPAQVVIFNNLGLFNVAFPFVFIYILIMLPVTLGTNISMSIGFAAGLLMDVFCDTPGLNTIACTTVAFARKPLFHLYVSSDDDLAGQTPSNTTMGYGAYMKYLLTVVLAYCMIVFVVETMQFFNVKFLVLRIVASTLYTFVLLLGLDSVLHRKRYSLR